jgi:hypothetical protein
MKRFMKKNKKYLILSTLTAFILFLFFISSGNVFSLKNKEALGEEEIPAFCPAPVEKLSIATCPTFYDYLNEISDDSIDIVFTRSTSESLDLLSRGFVDYVLSGRTLLPGEKDFGHEILADFKDSYSFLSLTGKTIKESDFDEYIFYTDKDVDDIRSIFGIREIAKVKDAYSLNDLDDKVVIITSWDNTDFEKYQIVHVLKDDESRFFESRIPVLYFEDSCDYQFIEKIKNIFK